MEFALGQAKMTDGSTCVVVTQRGGVFHGVVRRHKKNKTGGWLMVVETQKFQPTTADAHKNNNDPVNQLLDGV